MPSSSQTQTWPAQLWLVRHGESAGNVALHHAMSQGAEHIDTGGRDMDVPLSALGERQARAAGVWFKKHTEVPDTILSSPYVRARRTAELLAGAANWNLPIIQDERLREKEFGILDALTSAGVRAKYPEQAMFREKLGKFYHRPPGGESWCDVILRLRSMADFLRLEYSGQRVLILCHTVVVLCFRFLLEKLTEEQILQIDSEHNIANCSVTSYRRASIVGGKWTPDLFNFTAPVSEAGETVTNEPDAPVAPK